MILSSSSLKKRKKLHEKCNSVNYIIRASSTKESFYTNSFLAASSRQLESSTHILSAENRYRKGGHRSDGDSQRHQQQGISFQFFAFETNKLLQIKFYQTVHDRFLETSIVALLWWNYFGSPARIWPPSFTITVYLHSLERTRQERIFGKKHHVLKRNLVNQIVLGPL